MSATENKKLVLHYFDLQRRGELDKVFNLLSEDFVLRGMGMPPFDHRLTKEKARELVQSRADFQPDPIDMIINGITAEGERVAVEAERHDRLKNGATYDNRYHLLFIVKDGKIVRIDEYLCTYSFNEYRKTFPPPPKS